VRFDERGQQRFGLRRIQVPQSPCLRRGQSYAWHLEAPGEKKQIGPLAQRNWEARPRAGTLRPKSGADGLAGRS
jgi:hypothetical protein